MMVEKFAPSCAAGPRSELLDLKDTRGWDAGTTSRDRRDVAM
jgi:hypothetical protein